MGFSDEFPITTVTGITHRTRKRRLKANTSIMVGWEISRCQYLHVGILPKYGMANKQPSKAKDK